MSVPYNGKYFHSFDILSTFQILSFLINSLKVVAATLLLVYFLCLKEGTSETKKNVFYVISKSLFVLEIIKLYIFRYLNVIRSLNVPV